MPHIFFLVLLFLPLPLFAQDELFPVISTEAKPGAYWWWMGSAVDAEGIRWNIEQAAENGIGTLHIVPIYGVKGNEKNFIPFMTPDWLKMMQTAVEEAKKRNMNIDMTLGTGWCFGGAGVAEEDSVASASFKKDDNGQTVLQLKRNVIKVKRAAPGGEGQMLNPLSVRAIENYLHWFDERLTDNNGFMPRAFYHDSYEYFGANWSDELLDTFEQLNGYKLQDNYDVFTFTGSENGTEAERVRRIKADYRRTLGELHLAFIKLWSGWTHQRGLLTRNESHGGPANLLDTYATADIPETEFFKNDKNPLVAKLASSAAHVTGGKLVSSESGTWIDEHFNEKLGSLKVLFDGFFLSGINHLFYHGMAYSPKNADYPGWLFYAATEMNPRNTIWHDAKYLNDYIARVQSVLQAGEPDNEILVLYSPEDVWHQTKGMQIGFTVHNTEQWFDSTPVSNLAQKLWNTGLPFDYISETQLNESRHFVNYRVIVIPKTRLMDAGTLERILFLKNFGISVLFESSLPGDVPGFYKLEERRKGLQKQLKKAPEPVQEDIVAAVQKALKIPESPKTPYLGSTAVKVISRRIENGRYFFVSNVSPKFDYCPATPMQAVDEYYRLTHRSAAVVLLDPMTGKVGKAAYRNDAQTGLPEVRLQLQPNASVIIRTFDKPVEINVPDWDYFETAGRKAMTLSGTWNIEFLSGGPVIPKPLQLDTLASWTEQKGDYENFAGTAKYTLRFDNPFADLPAEKIRRLNLGTVHESARVKVNGADLGCVFCKPMLLTFSDSLLKPKDNLLEMEVTNLAANRIRWMDKEKINWKKFHDINFVNIDYKPFDASGWTLRSSGLLGAVTLE
jgi:hypothetical protein